MREPTVAEFQPGILHEGSAHHIFLEFTVSGAPRFLPGQALAIAPVASGEQVVAFGAGLLGCLSGVAPPPGAADFAAIAGAGGYVSPATQRDLFVWLQGERRDELFMRALEWREALQGEAQLAAEEHGFLLRDSRDLTGFVDGSANPKEDARRTVAIIADGDHAGGSFVMAQRWLHNLAGFNALPVADQERVIGRTKTDSIELQGDAMPANSHVSRTDIKRGGEAVKIYRRSSPVGGVRDPGLYFLAFSADSNRFRWLLESMYGLADPSSRDRLLGYSKPTSGSFFYAPPKAPMLAAFER